MTTSEAVFFFVGPAFLPRGFLGGLVPLALGILMKSPKKLIKEGVGG